MASAQNLIPSDIRQALSDNAAALTPLDVTWERRRTSELSLTQLLRLIKYHPVTAGEMRPCKVHFLLDVGKYYSQVWRHAVVFPTLPRDGYLEKEVKDIENQKMAIAIDETSFDGTVCYAGNGKDAGKMLMKTPLLKAATEHGKRRYFNPDFLYWAGFRLPQTASEVTEALCSLVISDGERYGNSSIAVNHSTDEGDQLVTITLTTAGEEIRYVLDRKIGYAVRRRTNRSKSGKVLTDAECSDFVQLVPRRVWLPRKINVVWHTWSTIPKTVKVEPILREQYRMLEWHTYPISADKFVLNYNVPGAAISDACVNGAEKFRDGYVSYRYPADPDELDDVIRVAMAQYDNRKRFGVVTILNVLLLLILSLALCAKHFGRHKQS